MAEESRRIEFAIYRRNPEAEWNVHEVNIGPLVHQLTDEPFHLGNVGEDGSVKLEVQRTHEWEIVVGLILVGSGIFVTGALTEIGKRLGGWLADRAKKLATTGGPEVRIAGEMTVVVDPADLKRASEGIAQLLKDAASKNIRVQVVLEPVR